MSKKKEVEKLDLFAEEVAFDVADLEAEPLPTKVALGASTIATISSFASATSTAGTWSTLTSASSA